MKLIKPLSESVVCVCDHGLFAHVARRLARDCKTVYYWTPWERSFPVVREGNLWGGFNDLKRIDSFWGVKDEVDFFVFPDIGFSAEQAELKSQGFPVWGAGGGDKIEMYRGKFMETLAEVGLQVPPFKSISGMTALREHLKDKEDRWIKISKWRGDWETFHWRNFEQDEPALAFRAGQIGPCAEDILYYVFEPIDTNIEDGSDGWFCGGKFPDRIIHGMEAKDKAYLGTFCDFDKLPEPVKAANTALVPILADAGYNGFFSTEVRIKDESEFYFTDPTCRCGSPPSQVMTEMLENFSAIIQAGAYGECLEPVEAAEFGVQVMVKIKRNPAQWGSVMVPEEIDQWFKPSPCMRTKSGVTTFPPDEENVAGWLVAIGDTIEAAIRSLKEKIELLPDGLECDIAPVSDLIKEVEEAENNGMEFTPQAVPEPSTVAE